MKDIDFTALLCSKLCHDLISPVSAVSNGVELLEDENDHAMQEQILDLIRQSSEQSSIMLQYYRAAFGAGGGFSGEVELEKTEGQVKEFLSSKKITLDWQSNISFLSKLEVKLLLNIVLITSETLIKGGDLILSINKLDGSIALSVEARGDYIILYPAIKTLLFEGQKDQELEARTAPAALIISLLGEINGEVSLQDSEEGVMHFTASWSMV